MHRESPADCASLGFGLGLRPQHYEAILTDAPAVDWFEILSENYLVPGGKPLHYLDRIRADYPMVMHGVSLSIGSTAELDLQYLRRLKSLAQRVEPAWISDHLCWTGIAGRNLHDLMPLPYTEEAIGHVAGRVAQVQDYLGRQILLENVPMEQTEQTPEIPEAEFLRMVAERSDSLILLDVANLHASSVNQGFDPLKYLWKLPQQRVQQIHLSGAVILCSSAEQDEQYNSDPIWNLYASALQRFGPVSTMIERMDTIAQLDEMVDELNKARCQVDKVLYEKR
jgi:uncharacterized protein (UPF0276 family)